MISQGLPLPLERRMIPCLVRRAVMDLTVRSDLPISLATNFCGADGFCCITRSTAISSKVQFLHFAGNPRAKFALASVGFALCSSEDGFQSKCSSRLRSGVFSPSNILRKKRSRYMAVSVTPSCRLL